MRKIKLSAIVLLCLAFCSIVTAQVKKAIPQLVRCGTEAAIEENFRRNPALKAEFERKNAEGATSRGNNTSRLSTLTAPVVIPVIVHVVLPNPNIITEAQIDYLLNRLNTDYSGLNSDSTNAPLFYGIRGHSLIRFTRARRTSANQSTNGIERRVGTVAIGGGTYQAIKHTSAGGLDPWDITQYYNIWVGDGSALSLLGIAPAIGVGNQTETTSSTVGIDGVCIDAGGFSNGCFSYAAFNLGRTAVHEIGHNFGLYHIFSGCAAGADFTQPSPAGQTLPANLVGATGDDTPSQSTATSGCPTGAVASNCAGVPNPPGKNYQNYMDYTNDACYSMFTKQQVERMHYMLETYRPGYLTTQGAVPVPGAVALDAGVTNIASPGGVDYNSVSPCQPAYPVPNCAGAITPRLSISNFGTTTITSVTVSITLNGGAAVSQTFAVSLAANQSTTLVFNPINLITGTNTIAFAITAVNNTTDGNAANNTISTTATVATPCPLPVIQDFTTTAFPPANLTLVNPDGGITWARNNAGNGNVGSAFINNYDYTSFGQTDDLRTIPFNPPAGATNADSVIITFDVAHKNYPGASDVLSVLVSTNCGTTFTTVYSKGGATLATAGASQNRYATPGANDWRRERIALGGAYLTGGPILVAFRNTTDYGNNIFLDNINIYRKVDRDLSISAISSPSSTICTTTATPQVTVTNNGGAAVTSFSVGYSLNGGTPVTQAFTQTIAAGASVTLTLAPVSNLISGSTNTFRAYTFNPANSTGTGDQQPGNDTLSKTFTVVNLRTLPLAEGFESTTFPPTGWTLLNPDNDAATWIRINRGRNSTYSAKFDNYNNNVPGTVDMLQTPAIGVAGADSIVITFDVAHKNYTGVNDSLKVLVSNNCGTTFTTYYAKGGATLATAGASTADYLTPIASDWRTERVAIPGSALSSGSAIIQFQNKNNYGNNIFLDNINITALFKRDIQLLSINQPASVLCDTSVTPSVTVRNAGTETITGFKVAYLLDNSTTPVSVTIATATLAANATQTVAFPATILRAGQHTLKFYAYDPITASGTGDANHVNDTLSKSVGVTALQAAPLAEDFDGPVYPPTGWATNNADGFTTWARTVAASKSGLSSVYMNNYAYTNKNTRDELYTPRVSYSGVDSVFLTFDLAAATKSYPGSTAIPLDTLEVLLTRDCGTTFTSLYKKWGNELQTIHDPNSPDASEFFPSNGSQWRNERINLSGYVSNSPIQIVFRNTNNNENNIYLDNVNLKTQTLPAKLKEQGYLIFPSPFTSSFTIQHYLPPTELRSMAVYNSVGQRMVMQSYGNNGATSLIQVNMSRFAPGLYTVVLEYANRTVSQKIIKAQ